MTYKDTLFPTKISRGATGGPKFLTSVIILSSGHEQRNVEWGQARAEYDVSHSIKNQNSFNEILSFFYNMQGRAHSFPFLDLSDSFMTNSFIATGDATEVDFQMTKDYDTEVFTYVRTIFKPNTFTTVVHVDDVFQVDTVDYTLNGMNGVVSFTSPPAAATNINVSADYWVPVRFDIDNLDALIEAFSGKEEKNNIYTWNRIPLVEVRGE